MTIKSTPPKLAQSLKPRTRSAEPGPEPRDRFTFASPTEILAGLGGMSTGACAGILTGATSGLVPGLGRIAVGAAAGAMLTGLVFSVVDDLTHQTQTRPATRLGIATGALLGGLATACMAMPGPESALILGTAGAMAGAIVGRSTASQALQRKGDD